MLNNFIGGGQVFLHKVRMFSQVFFRTLHVSMFIGIAIACMLNWSAMQKLDLDGVYSYRKAIVTLAWDDAFTDIRETIGKGSGNITYIDAKSRNRSWQDIDPYKVTKMRLFKRADKDFWDFATRVSWLSACLTLTCFVLVFLLWSRFGRGLKDEKKKAGSGEVLDANQVKRTLKSMRLASHLTIGKMPLVKDMETRHFLVSGSTGSGKTNLIHNLLPQVEAKGQPAIVIDQTGEMIAKYYNKERGDIIFNPFDSRSKSWDFWADCDTRVDLERFSKILIGFNRKQSGSHSDPFWENSAEAVFNACATYCKARQSSVVELVNMVCHADINQLQTKLRGTEAERFLNTDSKQTAASIASVLASNAKPLTYLQEEGEAGSFSMKEHFANIKDGSNAWLFLATKPSSRALTLPLIACLTELALAQVMEIGINKDRRIWTVIDELASLGKLPALTPLMAEGRKYGVCVLAGLQSLNQLYSHYGQYDGSTIFGQFGTSFFFRNTEPAIAKMISSMCGNETITRQQKNTSFGANTFRDGVSYNEQQQKKALVEPDDLASLSIGQCYTLLPEPSVRVSKIQTPEATPTTKQHGFIARKEVARENLEVLDEDYDGFVDPVEGVDEAKDSNATTQPTSGKKTSLVTDDKELPIF